MTVSQPGSSPATTPEATAETAADTPPPMAPPVSWAPAPPAQAGPMPGLSYAGFWVRLGAFIVDGVVIGVGAAALLWLVFGSRNPSVADEALVFLVAPVYLLGYFAIFWAWRSQTPGMMAFGLRLAEASTGENIGLGRATLRAVVLVVLWFAFGVGLLGLIWVAFDARKQGWHDKLAGTVVIRPT